jgi:hypothetical protein
MDKSLNPREVVKELVSKYIRSKPRRISLKLDWCEKRSAVKIIGDGWDQSVELPRIIGFTSFAKGVLDAYREAYGELDAIPISLREEI